MIFQDCICFQLGRIGRQITRYYKEEIARFGLTHGQFFMLVALYDEEEGRLLPSQIAEKTAMDRPTTTGLLDRLERDGWVERHLDSDDRRTFRIHLTPKAMEHKEALMAIFEEINGRFVKRFSEQEWAQLQSLLQRLQ